MQILSLILKLLLYQLIKNSFIAMKLTDVRPVALHYRIITVISNRLFTLLHTLSNVVTRVI